MNMSTEEAAKIHAFEQRQYALIQLGKADIWFNSHWSATIPCDKDFLVWWFDYYPIEELEMEPESDAAEEYLHRTVFAYNGWTAARILLS